jgi:hypothetical protein
MKKGGFSHHTTPVCKKSQGYDAEKADSRQQIKKIFCGTCQELPNNLLRQSNNPIKPQLNSAEPGTGAIFP